MNALELFTKTETFAFHVDGDVVVLSLPDSRGKVHDYAVAATADGYTLSRLDKLGLAYDVRTRFGSCSCPAFAFGNGACKHVRAAKVIEAIRTLGSTRFCNQGT